MRKAEKTFWTLVTLAEIGIVIFWIAGFNHNKDVAAAAFFCAGGLCTIALGVKFFDWLRHRNLYGY